MAKRDANGAHFIGRLTTDPKVDVLPTGTKKVSFSIANNYYGGPSKPEGVNFFDIVCWGKLGEVCETYLRKGAQVYVEGEMRQDVWKDKTTGGTRSRVFMNCEKMMMLGSKNGAQQSPEDQGPPQESHNPAPQTSDGGAGDGSDDEVPF